MRALAGISLALLASVSAHGQSMAEAAHRERERRARAKQQGSGPVVTGDELKSNKGSLANDPKAAPAVATQQTPAPKPGSPEPVGRALEEEWRRRMAEAREQVEHWRGFYDVWSVQYLAPNDYFVDENGTKLVANAENLRKLIARAKMNLETAKQNLLQLEEQARRENVPPGWLR